MDEDFGKEAYRLSAIRQAPFYGCWFGGSLLTTIDGLRINENCQVLDPELNVIEGLYAAGDVSGSFFSGNYPEYVVGVACGRSSANHRPRRAYDPPRRAAADFLQALGLIGRLEPSRPLSPPLSRSLKSSANRHRIAPRAASTRVL